VKVTVTIENAEASGVPKKDAKVMIRSLCGSQGVFQKIENGYIWFRDVNDCLWQYELNSIEKIWAE
jgi:hypothetical protein